MYHPTITVQPLDKNTSCNNSLAVQKTRMMTGPDGAMAKSLANGLVGTGFVSRYRLQPIADFKGPMGRCKATTPSSLSLTSKRVTSNY